MSKFIPNSFQVPNAVIDEYLAKLSGNAFKCYAFIARQTTGWQKQSDRISLSQFMAKCGVKDRRTAIAAIKEVEALGLILVSRVNGEISEFMLNLNPEMQPVAKNDTSSNSCTQPVAKNDTATSSKKCHSTKDTIKNTIQNKNNIVRTVQKFEVHFEQFWQAGLVKVNKQKALKSFKSAYESYHAEYPTSLEDFTQMLVDDIRKRLALHQYGFDKLHPTTYLNNWRWLDEYPEIATSPQNSTACQRSHQDIQDTSGWSAGLTVDDGRGNVCQF